MYDLHAGSVGDKQFSDTNRENIPPEKLDHIFAGP